MISKSSYRIQFIVIVSLSLAESGCRLFRGFDNPNGDESTTNAVDAVAQNFPHIRTFASFYLGQNDPSWTIGKQAWMKNHIDMASADADYSTKYINVQLPYFSWPDIDQKKTLAAGGFVAQGTPNPDDLFYHFGRDTDIDFSRQSAGIAGKPKSLMEDRFYSVQRAVAKSSGTVFSDFTTHAYGDVSSSIPDSSFPFVREIRGCEKADDALYIGSPWPFRELNFTISQGAQAGWQATLEYSANNFTWSPIVAENDGTNGFTISGQVLLDPSPSWSRLTVNGVDLYWVRIRCTAGATSQNAPVFRATTRFYRQYNFDATAAISGHKLARRVSPSGSQIVTVPGWDRQNDANGDGFVDDGEFANRPNPLASARFKWEARIPAGYFTGRWLANTRASLANLLGRPG